MTFFHRKHVSLWQIYYTNNSVTIQDGHLVLYVLHSYKKYLENELPIKIFYVV